MRTDNLKRHLKSKNCIPANLSGVYEMNSINTTHLLRKEINFVSRKSAKEENKQVNGFKSTDHFTSFIKDDTLESEMIKEDCKLEKMETKQANRAIILKVPITSLHLQKVIPWKKK